MVNDDDGFILDAEGKLRHEQTFIGRDMTESLLSAYLHSEIIPVTPHFISMRL